MDVYQFDEQFTSCYHRGTGIDLRSWYSECESILTHIVFRCGSDEEEIALVDSNNTVRIFSLTAGQCQYVTDSPCFYTEH